MKVKNKVKLAIVIFSERYRDLDDYSVVASSITDWEEVDDETYRTLIAAQYKYDYTVVVMPEQKTFIKKTVKDWTDFVTAEKQKEELRKAAAKKKAEDAKLKKLAKSREEKIRLFEKLREELKGESV
jgi:hypothetical protein